jgi:cytochrome P450
MSNRPTGSSGDGAVFVERSPFTYLRAMIRNPLETFPAEVFQHPLVRTQFGRQRRLYVCDPALIHEGLVRNAGSLTKGRVFQRMLRPALGNGLLTAEGADWSRQRQSAAPAFQHARLLAFLPAMIAAAEETRERWLARGAGAVVDIGHEMMRATFAIIVETMLSGHGRIDVEGVERNITTYLASTGWAAALGLVGAPAWTPHPGRRASHAAAAFLHGAVLAMVAERRAQPGGREDLVALLLAAVDPETGRAMTDEEIADNLLTFITAGHETTAQGLAWTLSLLATHPTVDARMRDEIEAVTGGGPLRPVHVGSLAYTRQVFAEGMRLYPPAPLIVRRVERAFDLGEVALPPGSMLIVPIFALHRHRLLWPDPLAFDPDRFAPAQAAARPRYAYMPFGAGPRVCIGGAFATMEAVAILAVLLRRFALRPADARVPLPTMKITLRPTVPIRMIVEPRSAG